MNARKGITKSEAIDAVAELVRLNPRSGQYFDQTMAAVLAVDVDPAFPFICRLAAAATLLGTAECESEQECFQVGTWGPDDRPAGFGYRGQFTPGRLIAAWEDEEGMYIFAETGTDRASTYFSKFTCLRIHLPELCEGE